MNKHNEEIMKVIRDICPFYKEYGTCEQCNKDLDIYDEPCYWECMANAIINNGYRKASDVEREIFEEIERELEEALKSKYKELPRVEQSEVLWGRVSGKISALRGVYDFISELKKKYIGEDKNVTTKESEDTE